MPKNEKEKSGEPAASAVSRRQFIQNAALLTGGVALSAVLPDCFAGANAYAAQVQPDDSSLKSSDLKFNATDGVQINGYLTRPNDNSAHPGIVVIHQNTGLNDHIRDVARRLAKAGYVALAPDLLTREGGTSSYSSPQAAIAALGKLTEDNVIKDLNGAVNYLKGQNFVRANKIGVIGFCWGGGNALLMTTRNKDLAAAVVYYGQNPKNLDDVKNVTAAVLGQYGEKDERITPQVPKLEEKMKEYGKNFEYKVYPGAPHAFNDDTQPERYRPEAAKEAWNRTLEFFKAHLQA